MKKLSILFLIFATTLIACNQNKTDKRVKVPESVEKAETTKLQIVEDSTQVSWTAYKTTEKAPVSGIFKQFTIDNINDAETPTAILNGATINIPMHSVFTDDETRDGKLRTFFFEKLIGDGNIEGFLTFEENNASLTIKFNEVQNTYPIRYSISHNVFTIETDINLADFEALEALKSLHLACEDLHRGADGVSKTWEEVAIQGRVVFAYY